MFVYTKTPTIVVIDGVLSPEECNDIIEYSEDKLERSKVAKKGGGDAEDVDRTSSGLFVRHEEFPELCKRLSEIANLPLTNAESLNVLKYQEGQEYKPHRDAFDEDRHKINGGQRVLTCIVYLNNASGGGTAFPALNMIVGSIAGRLLMFENVDGDLNPHELSLHQGLPPHEGEKWVTTLWFRENKVS